MTVPMYFRDLVLVLFALMSALPAWSQGEVLQALRARPEAVQEQRKADGLNTWYIYTFASQTIPIADDFSIDRTRKRWAQPGEPGVDLSETIYVLEVAGSSEPDMTFATDTTFLYTTDLADPPVTTRTALPSIEVLVRDITVYPPTEVTVTAWPSYNVFDTIQSPSPDTLPLLSPGLLQDSLLVYSVAPDPRTYVRADNSVVPLVLWEEDDVYVNGTFPVEPPTIGVATFDGLSRTGIPYDMVNYANYGIADRLTSVPINLAFPASDSIYLSFFYQAQGLSGDGFPQTQDSLVLEFYAPEEDFWYRVWSTPYVALAPFEQVLIPIKQFRYLKDGFRMRFLNYATLSGAFDHWHLDYVRLAAQRNANDTLITDVAYVMPESTLLSTYTSMPFNAFSVSPQAFMASNTSVPIRNLSDEDRFITFGMLAREENAGPQSSFNNGLNASNNASSIFNSVHAIGASPNNFAYDPFLSTDAAFWRVKYWANATPDVNRYNDTTMFIQEVSNYYAYDDGTAEMTYGLNSAGAKLAYRFDLAAPDSLRAVRMYFSPSLNLPPALPPMQGSFLLTVWKGLDPEVIQHQNFSFSSPMYREDGVNKFVEYALDSAIYVDGTIYIGWTQTNTAVMNIGFDRNRDHQNKIFYKTSGPFVNTSFQGALMMRPVFVAAVDPFVTVPETVDMPSGVLLYPNPANDSFRMLWEGEDGLGARVECVDAMGRQVAEGTYTAGMTMATTSLSEGLYVVRLVAAQGNVLAQQRLIIQR